MQAVPFLLIGASTAMQMKAQSAETDAQVKGYEFNADVNERDITIEREREKLRQTKLTDTFLRTQGGTFAAFGKGGVAFTGSVWDAINDQAMSFELDKAISQFESTVAVNNLTDQRNMNRYMASTTRENGKLKQMATLMTGLASAGMAGMKLGSFGSSGAAAGNMTTASNNFSGSFGTSLARADGQFSQMFRSAGLQPING